MGTVIVYPHYRRAPFGWWTILLCGRPGLVGKMLTFFPGPPLQEPARQTMGLGYLSEMPLVQVAPILRGIISLPMSWGFEFTRLLGALPIGALTSSSAILRTKFARRRVSNLPTVFDPSYAGCGQEVGLEIWRIEKMKVMSPSLFLWSSMPSPHSTDPPLQRPGREKAHIGSLL